MFADGMCVFSLSVSGLQCLLNICGDYAAEHEIAFNCNKKLVFFFAQKGINNLLPQMFFWTVYMYNFLTKRNTLVVNQSPPAGLQLASGKAARAYTNAQDQEILPNNLAVIDMRKTFADSVSSLFRKFQECTIDAEVAWRLLKAAVVLSAALVCGRKWLGVANNGKN